MRVNSNFLSGRGSRKKKPAALVVQPVAQKRDGFIYLPLPPSVNELFDGGRNSPRRFTSSVYKAWQQAALYSLVGFPYDMIKGPVAILYSYKRPADKRARDMMNFEKALSDLLVTARIIEDDCHIQYGGQHWTGLPDFDGVRVLVSPFIKMEIKNVTVKEESGNTVPFGYVDVTVRYKKLGAK